MKARDFVKFLEDNNLMDAKIGLIDTFKGVMKFYPNYYDNPIVSSGKVEYFKWKPTGWAWQPVSASEIEE